MTAVSIWQLFVVLPLIAAVPAPILVPLIPFLFNL